VNNNKRAENIELQLPCNAADVSAARLTASSIANRLEFALDEIEDIKAAVSEACTYIIRESSANKKGDFKINFLLEKDTLQITLSCSINLPKKNDDDEMGIYMIKALMDHFEIRSNKDGTAAMVMRKNHRVDAFI